MRNSIFSRCVNYVKATYKLCRSGVAISEAIKFSQELDRHPPAIVGLYKAKTAIPDLYDLSKTYNGLANAVRAIKKYNADRTFSPSKKSHIQLEDSKDSNPEDRGKLFIRDFTKKPYFIREASEEEISQANVFAVGGIDFDTQRYLSSLLKATERIAKLQTDIDPKMYFKPLALHPATGKEERYNNAVKYNLDREYFSSEMFDFVQKRILPRMLTAEGQIVAPYNDIVFFSYSVGGREILMLENALRHTLRERGLTDKEIYKIFVKFRSVSVGFAVDIEAIEDNIHFLKVILFNQNDGAVLIPTATKRALSYVEDTKEPLITEIYPLEPLSYKQKLVFLSDEDGLFPSDTDEYNGHGLNSYIQAIEASEVLSEMFSIMMYSPEDFDPYWYNELMKHLGHTDPDSLD